MDVEKLIERLKNYSIKDKALLNLQTVKDAAEALAALQSELEKVKAERDAAVKDLHTLRKLSGWKCFACYYNDHYERSVCAGCDYNNGNNWQWRGPQKEE